MIQRVTVESETRRNLLTSRTVNCIGIFLPPLETLHPGLSIRSGVRRADLDGGRTRGIGRSELLFGCGNLAKQLRPRLLPLDRAANVGVSQDECQPGHQVQVRAWSWGL